MSDSVQENYDTKYEHAQGEKLPFEIFLIVILSGFSSAMLSIALFSLMTETGPVASLKVLLITGAAGLVTFGVNKISIEFGAPLAAIKYRLGAIGSLTAMLTVGGSLFMATYSGLVFKDVAELEAANHGTELFQFTGDQNKVAAASSRIGASIRLTQADLTQNAVCEVASSCISQRGDGGHGTVAIILEDLAARASQIADQFEQGEIARENSLSKINELTAQYQEVLGKTDVSIWDRRIELQQIDAAIDQKITSLLESVPTALLRAYSEELLQGISIADRPVATRALSALLKKHGESLKSVLDSLKSDDAVRPVFPPRPGVFTTFNYIGNFAPIAGITFVAELVMPITIWLMTFLKLSWEIEKRGPARPTTPTKKPDGFHGLINLKPLPSDEDDDEPKTPLTSNPDGKRG